MDTIFSDTSTARSATDSGNVPYDRERLLAILRQAAQRAAHAGRAILASYTFSVAPHDALSMLRAFRQARLGECAFWEQPAQQRALVGAGVATTIETTGPTRFTEANARWRALQRDAIIEPAPNFVNGPVFFGGFAFDPLRPTTALWEGFPHGLLLLPRMLFHVHKQQAALTINKMVEAFDDTERDAEEIDAQPGRLWAAAERNATLPGSYDMGHSFATHDLLEPSRWQEIVANAVQEIRQGAYAKVVLARGVQVTSETGPFEIEATLARLRASYPDAYIFATQRGERFFIGATPERLIYGQDGQLRTVALAGSAPRGATEEEDRRLGIGLLDSAKNRVEHEIVVTTIREALNALCTKIRIADTPHLLRLKNIQHLETAIIGELRSDRCILEALDALHPTPAVGGFPRQPALIAIRAREQLDRGWYAGPVGWIDANGNGEFAVALRSALVSNNEATLFAGCGIVADSQPESEYAESCLKLQVMLRGLGGED